jgi:deoxycytidine triphosphate deaminase
MANVLPDREIKGLLGSAILDGSESCIRVNSYEVRLGNRAKFDSTGEEVQIPNGHFLEIEPGDFVTIESLEGFDLSVSTLKSLGKPNGVFAWITPTTTMMREGFLFASTKVDAGYKGHLNWGIRNSSVKTIKLQQGEHLFKLTLIELSEGERPDRFYGDDRQDQYQGTSGIRDSARMIPANIPDTHIIRRAQQKIDPLKQLTQAGYPYNHIGTELIALQGKFEIVSKDVAAMKDMFDGLGKKIDKESDSLNASLQALPEKIDKGIREAFSDQFHLHFDQRMQRTIGIIFTLAAFAAALYKGVIQGASQKAQFFSLIGLGVLLFIATLALTRSSKAKKP